MSDNIFINEEDVIDNINKAKPDSIKNKKKFYRANKKCSWCYGRGTIYHSPPGHLEKELVYCKCVKLVDN